MIKRALYTVVAIILTLAIALAFTACRKKIQKNSSEYMLEITVLKTGKSDAILLESQNHAVLIDTADRDSGRKIARYLTQKGINTLDLVIITHFDKDHIGGFPPLAERVSIKKVVEPQYAEDSEAYNNYKSALKDIQIITAEKNITLKADDAAFEIYSSDTDFENKNNRSLITSVSHGDNNFLFMGDALNERCMEFIQNDIANAYDVIKLPHHGIYFEGEDIFLKKLSPKTAVITDSADTDTEKTNELLKNSGIESYHTKNGKVTILSDGEKVTVKQ